MYKRVWCCYTVILNETISIVYETKSILQMETQTQKWLDTDTDTSMNMYTRHCSTAVAQDDCISTHGHIYHLFIFSWIGL